MSEEFDPYRKWLGIAPHEQPPHHYRLLGIAPFEDDPDVIQNAADRQMAHIRTFQGGRQREHSQRILNELSAAKIVLLDRKRKAAYDDELHRTLFADPEPQPELPPPPGPSLPAPPPPAVMPPVPAPPRPVAVGSVAPPLGSLPVGQPAGGVEPLPMGTVPSAEPVTPSIPKVSKSRAASSTARVRAKKQNSFPMVVLGLVAVGTLLVAMVVFIATQSGNQEPEKKNGSSSTTVVQHDKKTTDTNKKKKAAPEPEKPEKRPAETPVKKPEDQSREQQFKTAIIAARDALTKRELAQAKTALDNANFTKSNPEQTAEVEHLRKLYAYLEDFWKAVRAGINDRMNPGDVFQHAGEEVELVKRDGDEVTLKYNNKEHKHKVEQLPTHIAALFARKALDNKDPKAMLPVAVFWAIDSKASGKSKAHERAKQLWVEAAEKGTKDPDLAQELGLDEAFISTVKPKPEQEEPLPKITPKPNSDPKNPSKPKPEKTTTGELKPAPTDEQQRDARMRFVKRYGEELAKVRTRPAEYEQFLQKLEKEADDESDDALQFMMYEEASEAAAVLLKHDLILKYIDAIAAKWDVDALRLKLQYFNKARPINSPATENFADAAAALAKQAEESERLDVAVSFGNYSIRVGEKVKGRDQKELLRKVRDWENLHDAVQKAKAGEEALAKNSSDPMAHLHIGRYLCYFKRDWNEGLKHLAESNSEEEKSVAADDLAAPKAAAAQAAVGERWYTLAKKKSGAARLSALTRSKYWLDLALPQLDAAEKSSTESRLKDIAKELGASL
jgi:hypothetical protein